MREKETKEIEEGLYVISVAAKLANMHPQTLRMYERKGLLRPGRTRNRRKYSNADISRLKRIHQLTQGEGINLSGVRKVLEMEDEIEKLQCRVSELELEVGELRRKIAEEMERLRRSVAISTRSPSSIVLRKK